MLWRALVAGTLVLSGCGGSKDNPPAGTPALLSLYPSDTSADVSIASRVTATISREAAQICRIGADNTTIHVRHGGAEVEGTVVFFVDGLRVDFTPTGLFD